MQRTCQAVLLCLAKYWVRGLAVWCALKVEVLVPATGCFFCYALLPVTLPQDIARQAAEHPVTPPKTMSLQARLPGCTLCWQHAQLSLCPGCVMVLGAFLCAVLSSQHHASQWLTWQHSRNNGAADCCVG